MLPKTRQNGQILLNTLIALFIFAILSQALFVLISASYNLVNFTRSRITARHLAQEKLEEIRNLSYDDVGTLGGIPSGLIPQVQNISYNGNVFTITTLVTYIDDGFDGYAPSDLLPIDYKRVRVDVEWAGITPGVRNPITVITDIAPKGIESVQGGGTLSVLVFDSQAQPVPQAQVHIYSNKVNPIIDLTLSTNDNGRIIIPGTPACTGECYQITVTKSGYSTDRTYSSSEVANPSKPHLSIIASSISEISFAIDHTSTYIVRSFAVTDDVFSLLPQVKFSLQGRKTIGTDTADQPVYKFAQNYTTDTSGNLTISGLEWDVYDLILNPSDSYDLYGSTPYTPISVSPGVDSNLDISVTPHTTHSLLSIFTDPSGNAIASVSSQLIDQNLIASGSSGINGNPNFGQLFFDNLSQKIYQITASVSGFVNYSNSVSVGGNTIEHIILTPQ